MRLNPAATAVLQYLQNKLRACCISQPYTALCLEAAHAQIIPAKLHCWYNTGLQGAAGSCKELLGGTGCCWELLVGMVDLGVPGMDLGVLGGDLGVDLGVPWGGFWGSPLTLPH